MQWFITHPALHFWFLGLVMFVLQTTIAPAPVLQVNYPSDSQIAELERGWRQLRGGVVSDADREQMIQAEIDRAILLNEAIRHNFHLQDNVVRQRLIRDMRFMREATTDNDEELLDQAYAMDLHRNDLVVRRRLIQMMESVLRATGENQPIVSEALQTAYLEAGDRFAQLERFTFTHVYVSRDRHQASTREYASTLLDNIHRHSIAADTAVDLGDLFVTGHFFENQSLEQVGREFGNDFAVGLSQCLVDSWCEAVESVFGLHHVWLNEKLPAEPLPFEAVKDRLGYELRHHAGETSLAEGLEQLRARYQVVGAG